MDLCQQCLSYSKTYTNISTYITDLGRYPKDRIIYVSAKQLPDHGFAIEHNSILLPFVQELRHNCLLHPSDDDFCDTEADSRHACIKPEQPPVRTGISGTAHRDNCLAGKHISNKHFNIFDDEIDLWSRFSYREEYCFGH
jgi:hypothetical protein